MGYHGADVGATLGDLLHASPLGGRSRAACTVSEHRRTVVILLLALDAGDSYKERRSDCLLWSVQAHSLHHN